MIILFTSVLLFLFWFFVVYTKMKMDNKTFTKIKMNNRNTEYLIMHKKQKA